MARRGAVSRGWVADSGSRQFRSPLPAGEGAGGEGPFPLGPAPKWIALRAHTHTQLEVLPSPPAPSPAGRGEKERHGPTRRGQSLWSTRGATSRGKCSRGDWGVPLARSPYFPRIFWTAAAAAWRTSLR